jgi:hypothetical protein
MWTAGPLLAFNFVERAELRARANGAPHRAAKDDGDQKQVKNCFHGLRQLALSYW